MTAVLVETRGHVGVDPGRADDRRPLVFDRRLDPLGGVGQDGRDLPRQARVVHLGDRQDAQGPAADEADVEFAALQEMLDEGGLAVGLEDLAGLVPEGGLGRHDGVPVQPDAGVLLGRVDDEGEGPLVLVDVPEPFDDGRRRRDGQAGALEQAQRHVLVAAQAEGQGGGAGHRVAEHADEGGQAHLVEGAVDDVVVLVEDDVGAEAVELALKDGQVAGERDDRDIVAETPQAPGDAADHLPQIVQAPGIGLLVGLGVRVGVVDQRDTELLHAVPKPSAPILRYSRTLVQPRARRITKSGPRKALRRAARDAPRLRRSGHIGSARTAGPAANSRPGSRPAGSRPGGRRPRRHRIR